jgi:hypothetical protein
MSVQYVPSTATLLNVATTSLKTILLPPVYEKAGRLLTIKDATGGAGSYPVTISTQGGNTFDNGLNSYILSYPFGAVTFVSHTNQWFKTATTEPTLSTTSLTVGSNVVVAANLNVGGFISAPTIAVSSLSLYDPLSGNALNRLSVRSTFLYFGNTVISGANVVQFQTFSF